MDLNEAIRTLYEERKQIDRLIAKLERRKRLCPGTPRRRRRMPAAKRLEVSRRMKEYWAARRLQRGEGSTAVPVPASGEFLP